MRLLFIDTSTKLETIYDLTKKGRGGMVTSLFMVTNYLAHQGYDVTVLSDVECTGVTPFGVKWDHEAWGTYDVLVTNRGTADGYPQLDVRHRVLWTHDLPHSGFIPEPKTIAGYDCTVFMSKYAERIWRAFYRDIGKSVQIPNGVNKDLFKPREKENLVVYGSAPNRGLDRLPLIADSVNARLGQSGHGRVRFVAYSDLASLHPNEVGDGDTFDYKSIEKSSVELRKPVAQREWARMLGRAQAMIMPTGYPEICSNNVLQALASGTPVFSTGSLGATPEWVRDGKNGKLTKFLPND